MSIKKVCFCYSILLLLMGCASKEHLLFFTNSSIGIDISFEQSQTPVKFIVGYKRQEGVLDPIGQGYEFQKSAFANYTTSTMKDLLITRDGYFYPKSVKDEAHSVIAKMNFGATGGGSAETNAAQWFATGKAAEKLAENPLTPAAISGNPEIQLKKEMKLSTREQIRDFTILRVIYNKLNDYVQSDGKSDAEAIMTKNTVDAIDTGDFKLDFLVYQVRDKRLYSADYSKKYPDKIKTNSFSNVCDYVRILEASISHASEACSDKSITKEDGTELTKEDYEKLMEFISKQEIRSAHLKETISKNQDVIKMINVALLKK